MPKYLTRWNIGNGDNFEVVELDSLEDARQFALDQWENDVERSFDAEEFDPDNEDHVEYDN